MTKQFYNRIFAVLIVAIVLLAAFPLPVAAESGDCGAEAKWELVGGILTVTGQGEMSDFTEDDPSPWSSFADHIACIRVSEGITSVGDYAFCGLGKVTKVTLPSTLTSIGARSFKECTSLVSIAFPDSLKLIDAAAFESCSSLNGIRFPASLGTIRDHAFYRCESLTSVTVPNTVFYLGKIVFAYCKSLTQAQLYCNLTKLPDSTFYACDALSVVVLPESLSEIGEHAFYQCAELETVYYKGEEPAALIEKIISSDESVSTGVVVTDSDFNGEATSITVTGGDAEDTVTVTDRTETTESDNSTVSVNTVEEKTYVDENGDELTFSEAVDIISNGGQVSEQTTQNINVTGSVDNAEGWDELASIVKDTAKKADDDTTVTVNVSAKDTNVSSSVLERLVGVELHVTVSDSTEWIIPAGNKKSDYEKDSYDLGTSVSPVTKIPSAIDSDTVFKVNFNDDTDFNATVGMYVGNSGSAATLYQKKGLTYKKVQSSRIDSEGIAWFNLASTDKKTDYYIAIDDRSVSEDEVLIPKSLYSQYLIPSNSGAYMDENGITYEITGRKSKFGISGAQFAIYVGAAMAGIILIVTAVMLTMNKMKKIKEKYATDKK